MDPHFIITAMKYKELAVDPDLLCIIPKAGLLTMNVSMRAEAIIVFGLLFLLLTHFHRYTDNLQQKSEHIILPVFYNPLILNGRDLCVNL